MKCPKCGAEIPFYNLKPNCEKCGVNIMYYTQEQDLIHDAKRAELEFASARIVVAKIKAAFIGGKLQIARIVTTLLCIGALVIPFAALNISAPFLDKKIDVGGLGIYNLISDGFYTSILSLCKSTLFAKPVIATLAVTALFVFAVIAAVVILVMWILNFLEIKKYARKQAVTSFVAAGLCLASGIAAIASEFIVGSSSFYTVKPGFGFAVAVIAFIVNGIINLKIHKADITLNVKENDYLRKDTLKKVKSGEISLDDLPLPIYETEEEKEARIKALEEALKNEEEGKE